MKKVALVTMGVVLLAMGCASTRSIVVTFPSYVSMVPQGSAYFAEVQSFDHLMHELNTLRNSQIRKYNSLSQATAFWNLTNGVVTLGAVSAGQASAALNLNPLIGTVTGVTAAVGGLSIFIMELSGIKGEQSNARESFLSTNVMIQEADLKFTTLTDSLADGNPRVMLAALRELRNLNARLRQFITLGPV